MEKPDLIKVMTDAGIELEPAGMKYKSVCIKCKKPTMMVDPHWQNFRCWQCGWKGDSITFLEG